MEYSSHSHTHPLSLPSSEHEFSRLLVAALINKPFRELFLQNPLLAIEVGYQGERFQFSAADIAWLASASFNSLKEFAQALLLQRDTPQYIHILSQGSPPIEYAHREMRQYFE